MLDNVNPTSNFHPYQPADAVPRTDQPETGLPAIAERVGIDPAKFRNFSERMRSRNAQDWLQSLRSFAMSRPGIFLGSIAVAAIAAGLIRKRTAAS